MTDSAKVASPSARCSGADGRGRSGGATLGLPDGNSPSYAARCLLARLQGIAPSDVEANGLASRREVEDHLVSTTIWIASSLRARFDNIVKAEHDVPDSSTDLIALGAALYEIEYDLRDEWTWPRDADGPENSPNVIHSWNTDRDFERQTAPTEHEDERVRERTSLYFAILALDQLRSALAFMLEDGEDPDRPHLRRELSTSAWRVGAAIIFAGQLLNEADVEVWTGFHLQAAKRLARGSK